MIDLPIIFTVLMGAAILAYVVLDGYDLGVGMLMPAASRDEQNRMVASIGPFWDAAAHPSALVFMLVGTTIVQPFIIGYTFYAYRVFRGKVTGGDPYS